jgi:hypothetical protein
MSEVVWPAPHPPADALVMRFFDRASPGWRLRKWDWLPAGRVLPDFWSWLEGMEPTASGAITEGGEIGADEHLEAVAEGSPFRPAELLGEARSVMLERLRLATAGLALWDASGDGRLMRAPLGLRHDQLALAAALRLLYQAPSRPEDLL